MSTSPTAVKDFMAPMQRVEMLRRAGSVERLHCVRPLVQRGYSVAEHTYNAMVIARELCLMNMRDPAPVMARLLVHDAPEVATGDIPANVKRASPDIEKSLRGMEKIFRDHWDLNEPEAKHLRMQKIPREFWNDLDHAIYKAADILELGWFCLAERRLGNRMAGEQSVGEVFQNVLMYLKDHYWVTGVAQMTSYLEQKWRKYA